MRIIDGNFYTEEKRESQSVIYYLPDEESYPVFIYFHGGGLVNGNRFFELLGKHLTARGIALASVEYRMYPEAKYPDYILDAAASVAFVKEDIKRFGAGGDIYVGGSSAGGYLSMMLCFNDAYLNQHGMAPTDIKGYVHDAGQPTTHFNVLKIDRGLDKRRIMIDEAAPLYYVGLAKEYSPMLFIVSDTADIAVRYEQTLLMRAALRDFGYDDSKIFTHITHLKHCEHVKMKNENGESLFGDIIVDFIEKCK